MSKPSKIGFKTVCGLVLSFSLIGCQSYPQTNPRAPIPLEDGLSLTPIKTDILITDCNPVAWKHGPTVCLFVKDCIHGYKGGDCVKPYIEQFKAQGWTSKYNKNNNSSSIGYAFKKELGVYAVTLRKISAPELFMEQTGFGLDAYNAGTLLFFMSPALLNKRNAERLAQENSK